MEYSSMLYIDYNNDARRSHEAFFKTQVRSLYVVESMAEANAYYKEYKPDIIIIELALDQALTWVKRVRQYDRETIFLALTKDSSIATLKEIVELSFSAYLIKPVEEDELRSTFLKLTNKLKYKQKIQLSLGCYWDQKNRLLFCQGKKVPLTPRETRLFEFLVKHRDMFCSDDEIYYNIWRDELTRTISTSSIRTLIKNLRRKVPEGLIINRYGVGYKIIA